MDIEKVIITIGTLGEVWHAVSRSGGGMLAEGCGPEEAIAKLVTDDPSAFRLTIIEEWPDERIPKRTILIERLDNDWLASIFARGRLFTRASEVRERAIGMILIEFANDLDLEIHRNDKKPTRRRRR